MIDTMAPVLALLTAAALAFGLWRLLGTRRAEREAERLQDRIWRISESEDRYRALVAATTEIIVQRDARGRITYANEDFARLLGREPIALIGSRDDLEILDRNAVEIGPDGVRRLEAQVRTADGRARWFAFVEMPVAHGDATHASVRRPTVVEGLPGLYQVMAQHGVGARRVGPHPGPPDAGPRTPGD